MANVLHNIYPVMAGMPRPSERPIYDDMFGDTNTYENKRLQQQTLNYEANGVRFRKLDEKLATEEFTAIAEFRSITYNQGDIRINTTMYPVDRDTYEQAIATSSQLFDAERRGKPIQVTPNNPTQTILRNGLIQINSQRSPEHRISGPITTSLGERLFVEGLQHQLKDTKPLSIQSVAIDPTTLRTFPGEKSLDERSADTAVNIQKTQVIKQAPQRITQAILPGLRPNNNHPSIDNGPQFE